MSEKGHIVHSQNSKTVQQINTWKKQNGRGNKTSQTKRTLKIHYPRPQPQSMSQS